MSKHNFLAYFPGAPNIQPESLTLEDSSYVRAALKQCAAEFGLQVQEDMRLIAVSPHRWQSQSSNHVLILSIGVASRPSVYAISRTLRTYSPMAQEPRKLAV